MVVTPCTGTSCVLVCGQQSLTAWMHYWKCTIICVNFVRKKFVGVAIFRQLHIYSLYKLVQMNYFHVKKFHQNETFLTMKYSQIMVLDIML